MIGRTHPRNAPKDLDGYSQKVVTLISNNHRSVGTLLIFGKGRKHPRHPSFSLKETVDGSEILNQSSFLVFIYPPLFATNFIHPKGG